jgi:outer membrane lipoprotein-sorting protein
MEVAVECVDEAVIVIDDEDVSHYSPRVDSSTKTRSAITGNTKAINTAITTAAKTTSSRTLTHSGPGRTLHKAAYIMTRSLPSG